MNQTRIHQLVLSITLVIGMILTSSAYSKEVENLLMDGGFEEPVLGWGLARRAPAAATLTIDTNEKRVGQASARIEITNVGDGTSNHNLTLDNNAGIAVEANKTYTVDFWTKAEADRTLIIDALLNQGPWTRLFRVIDIPVTTEWTRIHHTFQADATMSPVVFLFSFVDSTATIWLDHVRFYEGEFDEEDGGLESAFDPQPAVAATDVPRDTVLSWTPGKYAPPVNGHIVYLSENFSDVNDGIGGIAQDANSYAPPQRLDFSTTYYWRVDEVNGPPDYTVYEGSAWSFTTEPLAYAIENITVTASSSAAAKGPENTINGSGLDDSGLLHGKVGDDTMWLSDIAGPQPTGIEFQFDKVYKLHEMWVWNSNESLEQVIGFGFKDVTIEYSVDGTDYTTLGTTHEFARAPGTPDYAHNTTIDFGGVAAKYVRLTANSNWGGIVNQYGLSEIRFFHIPVHAREPYPDSGATDVDVDVTLGWRAGREAAAHDVYFSTDEQAVINGTVPVAITTEASYGPLSLDLGKTYYWRVDEVNEAETPTRWQSELWDFTTQEYFVVDDFEDYNDYPPNEVWATWVDGYENPTNGATAGYPNPNFGAGEHYVETAVVHGGRQSMPLFYSNTAGAAYSEAERTFAVGQNWTVAGAATLVLYFHGTAGNTGQLYLKVDGSKVVYAGDAGDIAKPQWQQWNIDLASLGIDLQNIKKLSIGIDVNGASGTLYIDDIRLYRLTPQPEAP